MAIARLYSYFSGTLADEVRSLGIQPVFLLYLPFYLFVSGVLLKWKYDYDHRTVCCA